MWSPRAQCDRMQYSLAMRERLEQTPNLQIWQDEVTELIVEHGQVVGVRTIWDIVFRAKAVIITAGTFLNGLMHIGRKMVEGGRCAEAAAKFLTDSIAKNGISFARMKTGTPVRIDARSVHLDEMEIEPGETDFHRFSYVSTERQLKQMVCWTCYTNPEVHAVLEKALPDSPLYNGQIDSIGPRYCPSIETKLVTFPDRKQHPLFLEPEGTSTNELYLNGFSSSLPLYAQLEALRKIPCFRDVALYRPGYAIEYDFFDPTQLEHTLESKAVSGLFLAGQVNGTTGYEEAAGQGLIAGINAALLVNGRPAFALRRDEAYIGVLIDDLVTKGVDEPYRMFTSRAEYRILLRQDNADIRLTPYAIEFGLASAERIHRFESKKAALENIITTAQYTSIKPDNINSYLESIGSTPLRRGCKAYDLVTRPEISLTDLSQQTPALSKAINAVSSDREETIEAAEIEIKYSGYIARERQLADKIQRLENIKIRGVFDYSKLQQLSTEARQKLAKIDPETLAQASRIPGISPSDISVLLLLSGR